MAVSTGAAILGSAAVGAVSSVVAGNEAADAQSDAARDQRRLANETYERNQRYVDEYEDANPYVAMGRDYGSQMSQRLMGLYGYGPTATSQPAARNNRSGQPIELYTQPDGSVRPGSDQRVEMHRQMVVGNNAIEPQPSFELYPDPPPNSQTGEAVAAVSGDIWDGANSREAYLRGTPGYQFAVDEGIRALDASASSRGQLFSSKHMRDIVRFSQGYADQLYGTTLDREMALNDRVSGAQGQVLAARSGNSDQLNAQNQRAVATDLSGEQDRIAGYAGGVKALSDGAADLALYGKDQPETDPLATQPLYEI